MAGIGSRRSPVRFISSTGLSAICFAIALLLLLTVPNSDPRLVQVRQSVFEFVMPVIDVIGIPFQKIDEMRAEAGDILVLRQRLVELETENRQLKHQLDEFERTKLLVGQYQQLLSLPPEPGLRMASGRVVADISSPFSHSILANSGRNAEIMEGQAVMGDDGLVGRVVSVGPSSSRILLLTDFSSRIPVIALASDVRGILTGRNEARPVLDFLPRGKEIKRDDLLVTSGDGGAMPVGLPVGTVHFDDDNKMRIELLEDFGRLKYVRIVLSAGVAAPPDKGTGRLPYRKPRR